MDDTIVFQNKGDRERFAAAKALHNPGVEKEPSPLVINLQRILNPPGRKARFPRPLVSLIEKVVRQKRLNEILAEAYPAAGSAFALNALRAIGIKVEVEGLENIPATGRHLFASNHPLGGLDGISLIAFLGSLYGDDNIRFPVNGMLMNVRPLKSVFLPINKYGRQGRHAAVDINEAYRSDAQMIMFPAGLVSRLNKKGGIEDLQWQKAFLMKAIESGRDIIPIRFEGLNRRRFYRLAKLRKRLGIKINIEQAFLPAELCAAIGARYRIIIGKPISCTRLKEMVAESSPMEAAARLRSHIYSM